MSTQMFTLEDVAKAWASNKKIYLKSFYNKEEIDVTNLCFAEIEHLLEHSELFTAENRDSKLLEYQLIRQQHGFKDVNITGHCPKCKKDLLDRYIKTGIFLGYTCSYCNHDLSKIP